METLIPVVAVLGTIGFIVGLVLLMQHLERKRTEAVHAFAQAHGYSVDPDVAGFQESLNGFKLFNQGRSRELKNLIRTSREDLSICLADYKYVTGSGKHQQTHRQTICVVRSERLRLPHFFLRRQVALFDALGKMFGGQDVNFEEDPDFSKAFVLQTVDSEDELRRLFDRGARDAFTALSKKGVQCEAMLDTLLLHYGQRLKLERLEELAADAVNVRRALR